MNQPRNHSIRDIVREAQRRVPAGQGTVQEAFTTDHGRPVRVKLSEVAPDTFYLFDEFTACAVREAAVDWMTRRGHGRVTVSCSAFGEFRAQQRRFEHLAGKVDSLRVLAVGTPERFAGKGAGMEVVNTSAGVLAGYRVALREGAPGVLFVARELKSRSPDSPRCLGFLTADAEVIDEVAEDIDQVLNGRARTLPSFDRLKLLHQTTQRVARELESYSRRMELAIQRARRRPDLLTPARFDRIVRQSILKMEELKEIPRRALRTLGQNRW